MRICSECGDMFGKKERFYEVKTFDGRNMSFCCVDCLYEFILQEKVREESIREYENMFWEEENEKEMY